MKINRRWKNREMGNRTRHSTATKQSQYEQTTPYIEWVVLVMWVILGWQQVSTYRKCHLATSRFTQLTTRENTKNMMLHDRRDSHHHHNVTSKVCPWWLRKLVARRASWEKKAQRAARNNKREVKTDYGWKKSLQRAAGAVWRVTSVTIFFIEL